MDLEKIETAVQMILEAIGEDPNRSGHAKKHRNEWRACMRKFFPEWRKDPDQITPKSYSMKIPMKSY